MDINQCIICFENIEYFTLFENCCHNNTCWKCSLTNRVLLHDDSCCFCKTKSKNIILTSESEKSFEDYNCKELFFDKDFKLHYTKGEIREKIIELRAFKCKECVKSTRFQTFKELEVHLFTIHNKRYCDLCVESRKAFLKDQILYDVSREFNKHQIYGEYNEEFGLIEGHPICLFCNRRFYNSEELFKHMYGRSATHPSEHEQCGVCKRSNVGKYTFYRNYRDLLSHSDKSHHVCKHADCTGVAQLNVFGTQLELACHVSKVHSKGRKKINLGLREIQSMSLGEAVVEATSRREQEAFLGLILDASVIKFWGVEGSAKPKPVKRVFSSETLSDDTTKKRKHFRFPRPLFKRMEKVAHRKAVSPFLHATNSFVRGEKKAAEYYESVLRTFHNKRVREEFFGKIVESITEFCETSPDEERLRRKLTALALARSSFESQEFKSARSAREKRLRKEREERKLIESRRLEEIRKREFERLQRLEKQRKKKRSRRGGGGGSGGGGGGSSVQKNAGDWKEKKEAFPCLPSTAKKNGGKKRSNAQKKGASSLKVPLKKNGHQGGRNAKSLKPQLKQKEKSTGVSMCTGFSITYKKKKKKKKR